MYAISLWHSFEGTLSPICRNSVKRSPTFQDSSGSRHCFVILNQVFESEITIAFCVFVLQTLPRYLNLSSLVHVTYLDIASKYIWLGFQFIDGSLSIALCVSTFN